MCGPSRAQPQPSLKNIQITSGQTLLPGPGQ